MQLKGQGPMYVRAYVGVKLRAQKQRQKLRDNVSFASRAPDQKGFHTCMYGEFQRGKCQSGLGAKEQASEPSDQTKLHGHHLAKVTLDTEESTWRLKPLSLTSSCVYTNSQVVHSSAQCLKDIGAFSGQSRRYCWQ